MAGGAPSASAAGGRDYPGQLTLFVFMACLVAATDCLIFGYDIGISGGVTLMDSFLSKFYPSVYRKQHEADDSNQYCKFASQLLTMFTSSLYLATLVAFLGAASLYAASITCLAGRKCSMFVGRVTFLTGCTLNGATQNVPMLILGRILLGVGVGFANRSMLASLMSAVITGVVNLLATLESVFTVDSGLAGSLSLSLLTEFITGNQRALFLPPGGLITVIDC
jgi:MFS family permease